MIRNYLAVAFRQFRRSTLYSLTNLVGLTVGVAAALLILLFVRHEFSFDRFHERAEHIHRLYQTSEFGNIPTLPAHTGERLAEWIPEIEQAVEVHEAFGAFLESENGRFSEENVLFTGPSFLETFHFPVLRGDEATMLQEPGSIVLTPEAARKYFGEEDAMGRSLTYKSDQELTVTGIIEAPPSNTEFQFDMLISWATIGPQDGFDVWTYQQAVYFRLSRGADLSAVGEKLLDASNQAVVGWEIPGMTLKVRPMLEDHLHKGFYYNGVESSAIRQVLILSAVALFLLLIACINYMNLATARASRRINEVGMRKMLGAARVQLMGQFFGEAFFMTLLALACAVGLVELTLPWFNGILGTELDLVMSGARGIGAFLFGIWILVGLTAGSYPAFFLSKMSPSGLIGRNSRRGASLRRGLVVAQFGISIVLIAATLFVHRQMDYLEEKQVGFDRGELVTVRLQGKLRSNPDAFLDALGQQTGIQGVSAASSSPIGVMVSKESIDGGPPQDIHHLSIDDNFLETTGLELIAGRNISNDRAGDSLAVLMNREAVSQFGLGDDPVGERWGDYEVVGIVDDFHTQSFYYSIAPTVFYRNPNQYRHAVLRIPSASRSETLAQVESVWNRFQPDVPIEYSIVEQMWMDQFQSEMKLSRIATAFSVLAVLIACLGLFGLAAFSADQRTREIGIRKALGATASGLVLLLAKDFLRLVLMAFVLSAPVVWLLMGKWLDDFVYRIDMDASVFLITGGIAMLVAGATVSWQAIRVANLDPVQSLRQD